MSAEKPSDKPISSKEETVETEEAPGSQQDAQQQASGVDAQDAQDQAAGQDQAETDADAELGNEDEPIPSESKQGSADVSSKVTSETKPKSEIKAQSETEQKSVSTAETKSKASRTSLRLSRRKKGEKVDLTNCRIGFLGAGKMTEAIVKGLINTVKIDPKRIFVSSKSGKNHDFFQELGVNTTKRSYDIFGRMDCDIIFLVFHGYVIRQLFSTGGTRPLALTTNYIPNQRHPIYVLSLVGGIPLSDIKLTLLNPDNPDKYKLEMHRIMLNQSVAYGIGLGAIDVEPDLKQCSPIIRNLLTPMCKLEHIPENNMDVACAIGGNGLTFCYYFLAALSDGAFKMGLPKKDAIKVAARTLQAAAATLLESGKHPADLRDACTSPRGPGIYGIHVLEKADCSSGISAAVEAAYRRVKELCEIPT